MSNNIRSGVAKIALSIILSHIAAYIIAFVMYQELEVAELGIGLMIYWDPSIILFFAAQYKRLSWRFKFFGSCVSFCMVLVYFLGSYLFPGNEGQDIIVAISSLLFC
jgi:hypothetical protein